MHIWTHVPQEYMQKAMEAVMKQLEMAPGQIQ
jgi:hypothetical protein